MTVVPDFDSMYRADADPWAVHRSPYEQRKLAIVLACLGQPHYAAAWDPSCGVGALAYALAGRADAVLATDGSTEAVELTRRHCAGLTNVEVAPLRLPADPPARPFDLIVLSEFWYYLDAPARRQALVMVAGAAAPRADLVAVHWRHKPHDGWLSGENIQREIAAGLRRLGWVQATHHLDRDFILDVHQRGDVSATAPYLVRPTQS